MQLPIYYQQLWAFFLGIRPVKQPPKPLLLKSDLTQRLTSTVANAASSVLGLANSVSSAAGELF